MGKNWGIGTIVFCALNFGILNHAKAQGFPILEHFEGYVLAQDINRDGVDDIVHISSHLNSSSNQFEIEIHHYFGGAGAPFHLRPMMDPIVPTRQYVYKLNAILMDKPVFSGGYLYLPVSNFQQSNAYLEIVKLNQDATYSYHTAYSVLPSLPQGDITSFSVKKLGYDIDSQAQFSGNDVLVAWTENENLYQRGLPAPTNEQGTLTISLASPVKNPALETSIQVFQNNRDQRPNQLSGIFNAYQNQDPPYNQHFTVVLGSDSRNQDMIGSGYHLVEYLPQNKSLSIPQAGDYMRIHGPNVKSNLFQKNQPTAVSEPSSGVAWGQFYVASAQSPGAPVFQMTRFLSGLSIGLFSVPSNLGSFTFIDPNQVALGEVLETRWNDRIIRDATRDVNSDQLDEIVFALGRSASSIDVDFHFLVIGTPKANSPYMKGFDYSILDSGVYDAVWGDFKGDGTADDLMVSLSRSSDLLRTGRISMFEGVQTPSGGDLIWIY